MKKFFVTLALLGAFFVTSASPDKNPEPETSDPNGKLKGYKAGVLAMGGADPVDDHADAQRRRRGGASALLSG